MDTTEPKETSSRREPAIRTMKSDIAEYLKKTKPSLVSLLAKQSAADETRYTKTAVSRIWPKIFLGLAAVAVVAAGGFFVYLYLYLNNEEPPPSDQPEPAPAALIFYEQSRETTIGESRREFTQALAAAREENGARGTFERLILRQRNESGTNPVIGVERFFELAETRPPSGLVANAVEPPQLLIYRQNDGPRLGILLKIEDSDRALEWLRQWEADMQTNFAFAFFGNPPPATLEAFSDRTYKNVDFRYLKLEAGRDLGIGYLVFPARRLIIIATSEETLRLALNRLFENR